MKLTSNKMSGHNAPINVKPEGGGRATIGGLTSVVVMGVGNLVAQYSPSLGWFDHHIFPSSGKVGHLTAISDCDKSCDSRLISKVRATLPGAWYIEPLHML